MGREWKIGDWAERAGTRFIVTRVERKRMWLVGKDPDNDRCETALLDTFKHLPGCTGWDWVPSRESESVVLAMRMAAEMFGGDDGVFNGAGFSQAMRQLSGVTCTLDGYVVSTILSGRDDVEVLKGGSHYRMIGYEATSLNSGTQQAESPKPIEPPDGYRLLGREEVVQQGDVCLARAGLGANAWRASGKSIGCSAGYRIDSYGVAAFARRMPRYRPFKNSSEFGPNKGRWVYFCGNVANQLLIYSFDDRGIWHAGKATSWAEMFAQVNFEDGSPFGVLETEPAPVSV